MSDADSSPYRVESAGPTGGQQRPLRGCVAVLLVPFLLGVAGFCSFGFLHAAELPAAEALPWRIGYGLGAAGSTAAACWLLWQAVRPR